MILKQSQQPYHFTVFRKVRGNQQQPEQIKATTPARQQPTPTSAPAAKKPAPSPTPAAQPRASAAPKQSSPSPSGRNVLSSDVEIKGSIKFSNDLVVDGKIEGEINSDGSLTVGENARITAEIKTKSVVIYGKVYGNIEVSQSVELKANCELVGDIKAASLSIEPGAIFVGKSVVGTPTSQTKAATISPATSASKTEKPAQQPNKPEQPQLPKQSQKELSGLKKPGDQKTEGSSKAPQPIKKP